jgi:hypothetical protein
MMETPPTTWSPTKICVCGCLIIRMIAVSIHSPEWAGDNEGCLEDTGSTRAPEYMAEAPETFFFDTSDKCCEQHYSYNLSECTGSSSASSNAQGSGKWYIDWSTFQCVTDSAGQLADTSNGKANLHSTPTCTPPKASVARLMSLGTTRIV